ncbi:hypothetical protein CRT60_00330 [Azospirillum palustre]|uniref:Uncharacterized protein n=1 Tax=Azospirillum palustre TaxID=2044885 RepID=A0A2B8BDN4_9PROT|nr:hypothetical protein [Azospirillum palustre]PGH59464.1 hypothetical protein CRT60_00330 [Azospirillum palustre]
MLSKIPFQPGIIKDDTPLSSEGAWIDADKVRFVRGKAQVIGGWETLTTTQVDGICRGLRTWASNDGALNVGLGTHTKLYAYRGGGLYDITPTGLAAGNADGTGGAGFGTGAYGVGTYSSPSSVTFYPRTWTMDNWGQNLVSCPHGGGLYEWALNTSSPAALITNAPASAQGLFVTPERILVAYGAHDGTAVDPLLLKWSDQENNTVWTSSATTQAGDYRLSAGSRIVRGVATRGQNLIWTDSALYSMRYLGDAQLVFSFTLLGSGCGLIGPNAMAEKDGAAFWLSSSGQFYVYNGGAPTVIPCPVRNWVMENLSHVQADKIYASANAAFNEIWWFYPDARDGNEVSRYVAFNYAENHWTVGTWNRTAWHDAGIMPYPVSVDKNGVIYYQERLHSANGGAIVASLESAPVDVADGDNLMYVSQIVPDFEDLQGAVNITLKSRLYPSGAESVTAAQSVTPATTKLDTRVTARQVALQLDSASAPSFWRLGAMRLDIQPTGSRR